MDESRVRFRASRSDRVGSGTHSLATPGLHLQLQHAASQSRPVDTPIVGACDPRYEQVRVEFERNFAERDEIGAAVCVFVDGTPVVDLAGGWADVDAHTPFEPDTLVDFYSVGKAFLGLCALQLVDAGLVALDDPIARVWPEFGAAGKEAATLRHALCHR